MTCLIDTQILIWSLVSPDKLTPTVRTLLQTSTVRVSQLSLFEITIKQKVGKLPDLALPVAALVAQLTEDGFDLLPIKTEHIIAYGRIPLFADHRDPFDRLLLATALAENLPIISADGNFPRYVPLIQLIPA